MYDIIMIIVLIYLCEWFVVELAVVWLIQAVYSFLLMYEIIVLMRMFLLSWQCFEDLAVNNILLIYDIIVLMRMVGCCVGDWLHAVC